jgi:hypothetical protein
MTKGLGLEWHVYILTSEFNYSDLFKIEHLVKLDKKWPPWSKWPMAFSQLEHVIKLDTEKHVICRLG